MDLSSVGRMSIPSTQIDALHAAHASDLLRYLLKLNRGDRQTAEDMLQETMLRAWQHSDRLPEHENNQRRWLFAVARRLFIDSVRARQVRPTETPVLDLEQLGRAEDTTDAAVVNDAMRHAFRRLSPAHRSVLVDLHMRGLSAEELAARLCVPVGTVKSRAHYALRALRDGLAAVD
ncbi:sigma-70 family RNA polymerase sigma factor [Cryptosporangium phraense]|uniref:sigma-70 family RNA polymerase sigma factor n=1 Tax=Cryptosporangium phraense TaxID=2593070 RepID=UPI0014788347|nr:sigma-70 family RNA polymerase sigma factor [Cryptosporangium phraense]